MSPRRSRVTLTWSPLVLLHSPNVFWGHIAEDRDPPPESFRGPQRTSRPTDLDFCGPRWRPCHRRRPPTRRADATATMTMHPTDDKAPRRHLYNKVDQHPNNGPDDTHYNLHGNGAAGAASSSYNESSYHKNAQNYDEHGRPNYRASSASVPPSRKSSTAVRLLKDFDLFPRLKKEAGPHVRYSWLQVVVLAATYVALGVLATVEVSKFCLPGVGQTFEVGEGSLVLTSGRSDRGRIRSVVQTSSYPQPYCPNGVKAVQSSASFSSDRPVRPTRPVARTDAREVQHHRREDAVHGSLARLLRRPGGPSRGPPERRSNRTAWTPERRSNRRWPCSPQIE